MSPAYAKRQSTREPESALAALRALIALFPKQHPLTKAWLEGQGITGGSELPERTPPVNRTAAPAKHREPAVQHGQRRASPARDNGKPPVTAPRAPPPPPPPPVPRFQGNRDEWGKSRPGKSVPFDDEEKIREDIKGRVSSPNAGSGFSAYLIPIMYSQDVGQGREVSVEVLIPCRQKFDTVLVGLGNKGEAKNDYFEVPLTKLGPDLIRELGLYVLKHVSRP